MGWEIAHFRCLSHKYQHLNCLAKCSPWQWAISRQLQVTTNPGDFRNLATCNKAQCYPSVSEKLSEKQLHEVWLSNPSGWWAAAWMNVLKSVRVLCDSLPATRMQVVFLWLCSFLMVVLLFNGAQVKIHHVGKLSITCFVWNRLQLCSRRETFGEITSQWYNQVYQQGDVIVFLLSYWKSDRGVENDPSHTRRTCLTSRLSASSRESVLWIGNNLNRDKNMTIPDNL